MSVRSLTTCALGVGCAASGCSEAMGRAGAGARVRETGADTRFMLETPSRYTCTYTKPMQKNPTATETGGWIPQPDRFRGPMRTARRQAGGSAHEARTR
ncbi:MAG: hypothetical protein ACLVL7_12040 [Anaerotruncus massiliensis (ex Togo et al. 2019)]